MPARESIDLKAFLSEFVAARRGLRQGRMFGMPAAYAGPRLFACVAEGGIICKLPADVLRTHKARSFVVRGRSMKSWGFFSPATPAERARLVPILEVAARYAAETPAASSRKKGVRR
jgi:hypothetical protein